MRQDNDSGLWLRGLEAIQDRGRSDGPLIQHCYPWHHPHDGALKRSVIQVRADDPKILVFPQNLRQTSTHERIEGAKYDGYTSSVAVG